MGVLRVLSAKYGDTETHWNPKVKSELAIAETVFNENINKGLVAWHVDENGRGTEQIKAFLPGAHEIVFTRRLVGG